MKLFLSPHNDDETLFGAFTLLRERPHVVICLRCDYNADPMYGGPYQVREQETARALDILGVSGEQWDISETSPDWDEMLRRFSDLRAQGYSSVWAPKIEDGGHPHHNRIGALALSVWPRASRYCTYTLAGKSPGIDVPFHPRWVARKMLALSCYQSQAGGLNSHKYFIRDQREYIAE